MLSYGGRGAGEALLGGSALTSFSICLSSARGFCSDAVEETGGTEGDGEGLTCGDGVASSLCKSFFASSAAAFSNSSQTLMPN